MRSSRWKWWIIKPLAFFAGLAPLCYLLYRIQMGELSANPISDITNTTGEWTIRLLMTTLAITPLRKITGWHSLIRFRRMVGLFTFFYGILHFATYIALDQALDFQGVLKDLPKRPFITAGFTAWILMLPLAVTSTRKWISRLGGKKWLVLHRLVYMSGIAAVIHYYWLVKKDTTYPIRYGVVLAVLLGFRLWQFAAARFPVGPRVSLDNFR